jgi:putative molybdopterin biosynthesis protein
MPRRVTKERGRTEYLLVFLVEAPEDGAGARYVAHPIGKGSGSITTFARADGFVRIAGNVEFLEEAEEVEVVLLGREVRPADLVVIGSHCPGLDVVLGALAKDGVTSRTAFVGSTAGLAAVAHGECDLAGIHLLDPATGSWNAPFLPAGVDLVPGWIRRQGIAYRRGDPRFEGKDVASAVASALADPSCRVQGRNRGSGTRVLLDALLRGATPPGLTAESRSHHAVAAAIAQGRADWGVCLENVAHGAGLGFLFVAEERYDLAVAAGRRGRVPVEAFVAALERRDVLDGLARLGYRRP